MSIYNPNIITLYLKLFYLTAIYCLTGYLVIGKFLKKSIFFSLAFFIFFGVCIQFLLGFLLVELNIKTKYLPLLLLPLFFYRFFLFYKNKKVNLESIEILKNRSSIREVTIFFICLLLSSSFYFIPFISEKTSGFYAYGGGDQTSYFGVSEFVYDTTLKENFYHLSKYSNQYNFLYETNFPVKSLSYYLFLKANLVLAPQFIAVSPISFAPTYPEESYSAFIAILLFSLNSFIVFLLSKFLIRVSKKKYLIFFFLTMIASGGLSLAWKHATPALFSWISSLSILVILLLSKEYHIEFLNPFIIAILTLVSFLLYLPSLVLVFIPSLYLFIILLQKGKIAFAFTIQTGIIFLLLGNLNLQYPVRLSLGNAFEDRMLLDYGLKYEQCIKALTGIYDFESLLSFPIKNSRSFEILIVSIVFIGFVIHIFWGKSKRNIAVLLTIVLSLSLSVYYYLKNGHYHVIRLIEFCSILVFPLSAFTLVNFISNKRNTIFLLIRNYFFIFLISVLVFGVIKNRLFVFNLFKNPDYNARASLKNSNSLLLTNDLKKMNTHSEKYFFWMHHGSVQSANNQIMFRNVKYFENSEYDYFNSFKIDTLDIEILRNSIFVYPPYLQNQIYYDNYPKGSLQYDLLNGFKLYNSGKGLGAVLVGAGLVANSISDNYYIRPHLEAGVYVWNHLNKNIDLEFEFYIDEVNFKEGATLTLREQDGSRDIDTKYMLNSINTLNLKKDPDVDEVVHWNMLRKLGDPFNLNLEKEFLWFKYENGEDIPIHFENTFRVGDKNIKLKQGLNKIRVNVGNKKSNVFRFIPRDKHGARAGNDIVLTHLYPYNPEKRVFKGNNLPTIYIRKVRLLIR